MGDVKPLVSTSNSMDGDAFEARFTDLCKKGLSLDEKTCSGAMKLFKETKHLVSSNVSAAERTVEEAERFWFSFVLYSLNRLSEKGGDSAQQKSDENRFTLCQILRATRLNIVYFFEELPQFVVKAGLVLTNMYGEDWETRLEVVKEYRFMIVYFFEELPQFVVKAGLVLTNMYGIDWESRLEVVKEYRSMVYMLVFSLSVYYPHSGRWCGVQDGQIKDVCKSYKRAFWELFLSSDANIGKQESATSAPDYLSKYHRFGWLLFLALRVHAFSRFADLVTCANGFVSVLAILILHVPICYRNFKINDSPRFVKKGEKGVDLLASLCNMYDASEAELRRTLKMTNKLMEDILKKKPCPAFECKTETLEHIDTDGLVYFEGLLEEQSFLSNLSILENNYNNATRNRGDLDERLFINEEDSLLVFGSLSGEDVNISGIKRKFDSIASPSKTITSPLSPHCHRASHVNGVLGPLNGKVASTPVSTAITTAKWLRTFICPLPSRPSAELQHFLSSCDKDVTNDVIRRAHIILEAIFPCSHDCSLTGSLRSANLMDDTWMEQRRLETLKLYYRVLEAMCTAEAQILRAPNLTPLLTNERFHRCMLACSAELVLATHKTATMLFPTVLGRTGITAFDLSKVIESFIRHEKSLPRELKRHLNSLEERLLESMVWDKGSSLYNTLIVARPALSSEINRLGLLAEPMPSLDAIAMHINFSGGIPTVPSLQKHETSPSNFGSLILGQNGDVRSPKRQCTDYRSVLVERNSFTSPAKDRLLAFSNLRKAPLQSVFASPTRPNPVGGGETCAETGINIFFSKINKLAAVWINGMVERLQLSQEIRESVYFLFQQILSQRTSLFFNHHIDQIILCCLYVVAKLSQLELPFKEITRNYRKQLQGRPEVYCSVFVDRSSTQQNGRTRQDHVGIVAFYNTKFIPAIKYLLEELDLSRTTTRTTQVPESLPSRPSAELQHFLSSCDKDVTNDVIRRAHIILEAIFPCSHDCSLTGSLRSANLMDDTWMEQRRLETLKLYYRVLEAMCTAEAQILRAPNLTPLLTNERFHRCMLACSAELVLATHKTATMLFPTVLGRTGITAFDLSKVIESFIRHEKSLPRELKRHLNSLEERLLESMVWDKGSSLYNTLIVARPALSSEINRLGLLAEPMPSLDAIAMHINFSEGIPTVPSLQKHETSPSNFGSLILLGPSPGSPKVASFPSLPDMSPMKVSAKHNVYVSPLRASKMDALISHSARSYYACVGESTRAFQSPSKDLTAINNQLNSTRNIRIKLKFDDLEGGLVSDSMVANSLYLQSWSHTLASSPGAALKSEQPES
ncbi:hypothetical protein GOBAR_AA29382 [Gossypium barbadense]|uniref:Retinoblastoma-related protein n=1 Tax=Gossypium barbadense TaxID=3634 RepID=A0A2P5WJR2_GOSBA|nr:hypothetical protein GOBAR_AA29382 [Gossypium barbadense]